MDNSTKTSAIVFLPREGEGRSIMLENILFDPAAVWLRESLRRAGVARFMVVCHRNDRPGAEACFPKDAVFVATGDPSAVEELHSFLETPGRVIVVTQPVFLLDEDEAGDRAQGVYDLSQDTRKAVLDGADFLTALRESSPNLGELSAQPVDRRSLAGALPALAKAQSVRRLQAGGVVVVDPSSVYVSPTVSVGSGTVLLPGTILRGETHIGPGCEIGPNALLKDVTVGASTTINASQCLSCSIGSGTTVGPFAYLRPDTKVGDGVRVGDFVELKNSVIGHETKISHLAYLGDCDVGEDSDIGCGTVTVNYDGVKKFRTVIGDGAFIGCNTNLIAPVTIGRGAYVAAGSTITRDVPSESLAIARSQQTVKNQWVKKRQARQKDK